MSTTPQSINVSIQVAKGVPTAGFGGENVELIVCDPGSLLLVFKTPFTDANYLLLVSVDHDANGTLQFANQVTRNASYAGLKFTGWDENTNANISVSIMGA